MPNVLYGDLGSERMLYNTSQLSESIISGLYNACTGRTLGFCYTGNKCGLWYLIDKFGARGGGYLSGTYGLIGGVPADVFLGDQITYCNIDEFKNESYEGSCHFPLEGRYMPDIGHAALIIDKLIASLSSGTRLWLDFDEPTATEEEHIKRGIEYLSFILYALPPALQAGISFASNLSTQKLTGAKVDIAVLPFGYMDELPSQEAAWLENSVIHCDRPIDSLQCSSFAEYVARLVTKEVAVDEPAEAFISELINMDIFMSDDNREAYVYPYLYQLYYALQREDTVDAFLIYKELRGYRCFRAERTDLLPAYLEEMRLQDLQETEDYYASYSSYQEPQPAQEESTDFTIDSFNMISLDFASGRTEELSESECRDREREIAEKLETLMSGIVDLNSKVESVQKEWDDERDKAEEEYRQKKSRLWQEYDQKQKQLEEEFENTKSQLKNKYEAILSQFEAKIDSMKELQGKMKSEQAQIMLKMRTLTDQSDISFDTKNSSGYLSSGAGLSSGSGLKPAADYGFVQTKQTNQSQKQPTQSSSIPTLYSSKKMSGASSDPYNSSGNESALPPEPLDVQAFESLADKYKGRINYLIQDNVVKNKLEEALTFEVNSNWSKENVISIRNISLFMNVYRAMDEFAERLSCTTDFTDDEVFKILEQFSEMYFVGFVFMALKAGYNPIKIPSGLNNGFTPKAVPMTGETFLAFAWSVYSFTMKYDEFTEQDFDISVSNISSKLSKDKHFIKKYNNLSGFETNTFAKGVFIWISFFVISMITGCYGTNEGGTLFETTLTKYLDNKKLQDKRNEFYRNWHLEEKVNYLYRISGNTEKDWETMLKVMDNNLVDNGLQCRIIQRLDKLLYGGKKSKGRR